MSGPTLDAVSQSPTASPSALTFADLDLSVDAVKTLAALRITEPTPIQAAVLPDALAGRDVLGKAPTGSGKTLAFGLPLLHLVGRAEPRRPRGLVLAPTRELAEQIKRDLLPLGNALERNLIAIYGGVAMGPQVKALRKGVDVVIATPGRLMDLIDQGEVSLDQVDRVVVDEADRMADMGFLPDVRAILDLTSPSRQTVLFSATLDRAVAVLTEHYQNDPVTHRFEGDEADITEMNHRFIRLKQPEKIPLAADIIDSHGSTMVFCRTRHGVDRVCQQLKTAGVKAAWIHGGRSQAQRDAALMAFTDGRAKALVATDVAARGIHVDDVACVLHFDPPADAKDYVHRSGRTARAGQSGQVISFVTNQHYKKVVRMQDVLGLEADFETAVEASERRNVQPVTDAHLGLEAHGHKQRTGATRPKNKRRTESRSDSRGKPKSAGRGQSEASADERTEAKPIRSSAKATGGKAQATGGKAQATGGKAKATGGKAKATGGKAHAKPGRSGKPRPKNRKGTSKRGGRSS